MCVEIFAHKNCLHRFRKFKCESLTFFIYIYITHTFVYAINFVIDVNEHAIYKENYV